MLSLVVTRLGEGGIKPFPLTPVSVFNNAPVKTQTHSIPDERAQSKSFIADIINCTGDRASWEQLSPDERAAKLQSVKGDKACMAAVEHLANLIRGKSEVELKQLLGIRQSFSEEEREVVRSENQWVPDE